MYFTDESMKYIVSAALFHPMPFEIETESKTTRQVPSGLTR